MDIRNEPKSFTDNNRVGTRGLNVYPFDNDDKPFQALDGKYTIIEKIGHGTQASVYKAKDNRGDIVAIKVFDFRLAEDWKAVDLIKREIATLQTLTVDGIPKYIDHIEALPYFYLIESYIDASSLKRKIEQSVRFDELQILEILEKTLCILKQLHSLVPPVLHRDIKPSNLLIDIKEDKSIQTWIVDFGSVTAAFPSTRSSTLAGTAGYAAPEQLFGRATAASDIYGLGMTILHLVTGVAPYDMEMDGLTLDFKQYLPQNLSIGVMDLLTDMIQPNPQERIQNACEVLDRVKNLKSVMLPISVNGNQFCLMNKTDGNGQQVVVNGRCNSVKCTEDEIVVEKLCDNKESAKVGTVVEPRTGEEVNKVDKPLEYYAHCIKFFSIERSCRILSTVQEDTKKTFDQIISAYDQVEKYALHTDDRYFSRDYEQRADYFIELIEKELREPGYHELRYIQALKARAYPQKLKEQKSYEERTEHPSAVVENEKPKLEISTHENSEIDKTGAVKPSGIGETLTPIIVISCFVGLPILILGIIYGMAEFYEDFGLEWSIGLLCFAIGFIVCAFVKKLKIYLIIASIVAAFIAIGYFWGVVEAIAIGVLVSSIAIGMCFGRKFGCFFLALSCVIPIQIFMFFRGWITGIIWLFISILVLGVIVSCIEFFDDIIKIIKNED